MPTLFKIVKDSAKSIREKCVPVGNPSAPEMTELLNQMHEYLVLSQDEQFAKEYNIREGVGLAAPQIGKNIRALVIYYKDTNSDGTERIVDHRLINPRIISESVKVVALDGGEGCLSVDEHHEGYIYRPYRIMVEAFDVKQQKKVTFQVSGYEAIVMQHEMDHLNGVLYYDHINQKDPFYIPDNSMRI